MTSDDRKINLTMREKITLSLEQQMSEYELLKSMYPDSNDIVLSDKNIIKDIACFIDGDSEYSPNHLDFVINLKIDDMKVEVCVTLPTFYPEEEGPEIYVRCNQLNRQQEKEVNDKLFMYLNDIYSAEVCLYTALTWIQDNIETIRSVMTPKTIATKTKETRPTENAFVRFWIYSHHIYNKRKREDIVNRARDFQLTGFCLPGKPGIICIEGAEDDANLWWKDIKSMTWKKIALRKVEKFDKKEQKNEQKFNGFAELHFPNISSSRNSKHADMSGFSKYMEECGLIGAFNDFFGLSNE